ncbi:chemotaxis protein CheY [Methanosarcina sp. 1.H.T.1A.1]|uniref:response regulator n=1 Tax=Methanosarcina sp. 1.H.T.1A.1 TaxID=1483602 RepID=UPI000621160E|nr:response regulator [Methanosarcina sp. 1.H.T.1A.1]KKI00486.1 chemotaxis protein CheY [Methanosarcina sp. 1.H.T.1A.1]
MKNILVVEDNPLIMELVRTLLVSFGYKPIEAVDGNMAIELSKQNKFDIVLLDIQLPGIDGTEVLKILKEDPATCEIPVIALTAHAMRGDEEKFLKAGCSGYISKPIDIQRFRSIIAEFIA